MVKLETGTRAAMTADDKQTLREDIAFMKALADEGVSAPLLAGPWLMFAGIGFGGASLACWIAYKFFHAPGWFSGAAYGGVFVLFLAVMPFKAARQRQRAGHNAPANRATSIAWGGIGLGIFSFCTGVSVACWKLDSSLPAAMIPSAVLVLYGAAWMVSATMSRQAFLWWPAMGSYACAIGINFFADSVDMSLVYAGVLILLAFVPGYVLWKREPKDIV